MTLWLDAQLSPTLARWMEREFGITVLPIREVGLREADDKRLFFEARKNADIVVTKDSDFVLLLRQHGSPPKIVRQHIRRRLAWNFNSAILKCASTS